MVTQWKGEVDGMQAPTHEDAHATIKCDPITTTQDRRIAAAIHIALRHLLRDLHLPACYAHHLLGETGPADNGVSAEDESA